MKDGHQPLNNFLVFLVLLFTTLSIAVLKAWIIIIEVKLKMSWLLIIFSPKRPYVVIDLTVCTEGLYATISHACGRPIKATI
jgi:hypothetical protein